MSPSVVQIGDGISLIFLLSMLYVSLFFLIGLFLSALTHRASITLMFSMCVWVLFVLIVPNLTVLLVEHASPIQSEEPYTKQGDGEQWKKFEAEVKDYLQKQGVEYSLDLADPRGIGSRSGVNDYDSGETVSASGFRNEDRLASCPSVLRIQGKSPGAIRGQDLANTQRIS